MALRFAPYPDVAGGAARGYALGSAIRDRWTDRKQAEIMRSYSPEEVPLTYPEQAIPAEQQAPAAMETYGAEGLPTSTPQGDYTPGRQATNQAPAQMNQLQDSRPSPYPSSDVRRTTLKRAQTNRMLEELLATARSPAEAEQMKEMVYGRQIKNATRNFDKAIQLYDYDPKAAATAFSDGISAMGGMTLVTATPDGLLGFDVDDEGNVSEDPIRVTPESIQRAKEQLLNQANFRTMESQLEVDKGEVLQSRAYAADKISGAGATAEKPTDTRARRKQVVEDLGTYLNNADEDTQTAIDAIGIPAFTAWGEEISDANISVPGTSIARFMGNIITSDEPLVLYGASTGELAVPDKYTGRMMKIPQEIANYLIDIGKLIPERSSGDGTGGEQAIPSIADEPPTTRTPKRTRMQRREAGERRPVGEVFSDLWNTIKPEPSASTSTGRNAPRQRGIPE